MDETLIVLEKLNQFYSSSFSQLVTITTGLLAFVGVVVPILITFYQNRQFRQEQNYILKALEESKIELIKHVESEVTQKFELEKKRRDEEITMLRGEFEKASQISRGGVCFVQANNLLKQSSFTGAMNSYIDAIQCFIKAEDELNFQRASKMLIDSCLPKILKDDFECREKYDEKIRNIAVQLEKINSNGRYTDLSNRLLNALEKALIRTEKA